MADNRFKVMAVGTFKESAVDCPVQLKKYQIIYDVVADKTYLRAVLESFSDKDKSSLYVAMTRTYKDLFLMYSGNMPAILSAIPKDLYKVSETDIIEDL